MRQTNFATGSVLGGQAGGVSAEAVERMIREEIERSGYEGEAIIVRFS
jgi:hypothetical protein